MCLLREVARALRVQHSGTIVVISSIAGERGKARNLVYAAAKAGLSAYAQGLRNELHPFGVHVLTIVAGNAATPMTRGRTMRGPVASPAAIAAGLVRALDRRRDVAFVPSFWRYVTFALKLLPESVYKRVSW